jgi:hypothetical protein
LMPNDGSLGLMGTPDRMTQETRGLCDKSASAFVNSADTASSLSSKARRRVWSMAPPENCVARVGEITWLGWMVGSTSGYPGRVRYGLPTADLCIDGDLSLTTRSEAALKPPRFIYRMLTGRRASVRRQAWSWYRAPDGVARLIVIP